MLSPIVAVAIGAGANGAGAGGVTTGRGFSVQRLVRRSEVQVLEEPALASRGRSLDLYFRGLCSSRAGVSCFGADAAAPVASISISTAANRHTVTFLDRILVTLPAAEVGTGTVPLSVSTSTMSWPSLITSPTLTRMSRNVSRVDAVT